MQPVPKATASLEFVEISSDPPMPEQKQGGVREDTGCPCLSSASSKPLAQPGAQPDLHPMEILRPDLIYQELAKKGKKKAEAVWWKTFIQGIYAGCYVGFGAVLAMTVGGGAQGLKDDGNPGLASWIFGAVFPVGLIMVENTGADLFTGNAACMVVALVEGKSSFRGLVKNWTCSYLGNFVGSLLLSLFIYHAESMSGPAQESAVAISEKKMKADFGTAVLKGALCNWLVCIAIWQSAGCKDFASKALAAWLPVSAFVVLGWEHSVANMFFVPLGMHHGSPVTWGDFIVKNLIPVTIGNIIGGSLIVALGSSLVFGKPGKAVETWIEATFAKRRASKQLNQGFADPAASTRTLENLGLEDPASNSSASERA